MKKNQQLLATLAIAIGLTACGGGSDGDGGDGGGTTPPPTANQPPVVTVKPGSTEAFELMAVSVGVEATDPEGDTLSYKWKQLSGTPLGFVEQVEGDSFSFGAPKVVGSETLSFVVEVSDGTNTVEQAIDLRVKEAETIVMLASMRQNNMFEVFRKHFTDNAPVHLDIPLNDIDPGDFADAYHLRLSPDRRRAAWLDDHDLDGSYELKIVEVAGHGTHSLTPDLDVAEGETVHTFQWSPDSQSIAYEQSNDTTGESLYVVPAESENGSDARLVSGTNTGEGSIFNYYWSPDSEQIAFFGVNIDSASNQVFIVAAASADGSDRREFGSVTGSAGTWAPDSSRFLYPRATNPGVTGLVAIDADAADGSAPTIVIDGNAADLSGIAANRIAFSSDGSHIAFLARAAATPTLTELFVARPDGTDLRRVSGDTVVPDAVKQFRWSPDGGSLAFVGDLETSSVEELFVVPADSADGNDRRKISGTIPDVDPVDGTPDGDVFSLDFTWSPDSASLAFSGEGIARAGQFDVFISSADGDGTDRRHVSGPAADFDGDTITDSRFLDLTWSADGRYLYFTGDLVDTFENELLRVGADSTDGSDRVSVSGPPATGGGLVSEYVIGGPSD